MTDDNLDWPLEKLSALRLGRRLAVEVPASGPGRRAFVTITPLRVDLDRQAQREGWTRRDDGRTFRIKHWDYDADLIEGYDYDIGAVLVRSTEAVGESQLLAELQRWGFRPSQFQYAWDTADPV